MGTERNDIEYWIQALLSDDQVYSSMANAINPYGDGFAAGRTVEAIRYFFGLRADRPPPFEAVSFEL